MQYAPIIIFAFNRLDSLNACVVSLRNNPQFQECNLFVYVDGPRANKEGESEKVESVRAYVKSIKGSKTLTWHFSEKNKGLALSIIEGVTEVLSQYGTAIVIEDDLIVSNNFLSFMNNGLEKYEYEKSVWSICGFSCKVKTPRGYNYDAYFCPRNNSWGWATWKDRWMSCDWELKNWDAVIKKKKEFNRWGGSDCFGMLNGWHDGHNQSWAIRFCYNQFLNNALSLFPTISKIDNVGFDGSGTNCKMYNRYKFDFDLTDNKTFRLPKIVCVNKYLLRQFLSYYSVFIRIYSRLIYSFYEIIKK